jgi:glycosyltransferase involved in cell wall biosynthesis
MTGAILELINDSKWAIELGQNARKRALKRHNPDDIVNNLLAIYRNIVSQNKWDEEKKLFFKTV